MAVKIRKMGQMVNIVFKRVFSNVPFCSLEGPPAGGYAHPRNRVPRYK
jgi:hypothetical protein